jgi:7-cyano-7-deazaguanine synthase
VADLGSKGREVTPIYVRFGLAWEDVEVGHLRRFLASLDGASVNPLVVLDEPVADVYGAHWSVTGRDVPDDGSPDDAVYLPGRNLLLLAKSSVWCALNGVPTIALGTLAANPFPDADSAFFDAFSSLAEKALGCPLEVVTPFAGRAKDDVVEEGRRFALDLTFSCIAPRDGYHCGCCNKCAERRVAFARLGVADTTEYAR